MDLHEHLKEHEVKRALREAADRAGRNGGCIVLISPVIELPRELEPLAVHYTLPLPSADDHSRTIRRVYTRLALNTPELEAQLSQAELDRMTEALIGFTEDEAERLITQVILRDGRLDIHDLEEVREFKRRAASNRGLLETLVVSENLDSIGGLDRLKEWLRQRRNTFGKSAREFGLEPPKGMLLLGVQGCGKSLCAKVVSGEWRRPLLRLDIGALYNKFVGATEANLRESLRQAEASAPCVLWIDEIEKAFASTGGGSDADGGVSQRLFATLLSWMNDRTSDVFMAATANDITRLPPELMRKGRFDEIFFVDLPPYEARTKIFDIHLTKRRRDPKTFDTEKLAQASEGYSGAEIEQAIVSALYDAFDANAELNTEHVIGALARSSPMSVVMAERIESLRRWAQQRCVMAHAT
ncbi:MAG: AAA family ATPase [Planctomycetes bacterium]|nr:AAA family ATPase [Planctomycetota bacterium]